MQCVVPVQSLTGRSFSQSQGRLWGERTLDGVSQPWTQAMSTMAAQGSSGSRMELFKDTLRRAIDEVERQGDLYLSRLYVGR